MIVTSGIYKNTYDGCHYRISAEVYLNETYIYFIECLDSKVKRNQRHLLNPKEFNKQVAWNCFNKVEGSKFEEIPVRYHTVVKPDNISDKFYYRLQEQKKKKKGKRLTVTKTRVKKK